MESGFKYYAFISYKHKDEKWAKWLQDKLISYKLPSFIRKEIPRLPKRIRPVFRDNTNFDAKTLKENIKFGLENSRYLIVLCSPRSAKSEYVGMEIEEFVKMGRANHIIPFIVDGEPNSGKKRECFHPIIKKEIPDMLAINIKELGKQKAFIKLAARLLDLRFDSLWKPEKEKQLKQIVIAAVAGLLLLVGAGFVWDYNSIKEKYYADYVDNWGIPEGIVRLSKSQMKKRNSHYRFYSDKGILRKVVHANSAGTAVGHDHTEYTDRPAIQVLTYENNDTFLNKTELKNAQGKTIAFYLWSGEDHDKIVIWDKDGNSITLTSSYTSIFSNLFDTRESFSDNDLYEQSSENVNITNFKLERDGKGHITQKLFKKINGEKPSCDTSGIWGFEYKLDNLGRVEELYYLGYANEEYFRSPDKRGVMGRKYKYDEYGNISRTEYFDKDKNLIFNDAYWAIIEDTSNKNGNIEKRLYFGDNGNVLDDWDRPWETWKYDEKGNRIEKANSRVKITAEYDIKRGLMIKEIYHMNDGAYSTWKYDKHGNIEEMASYDGNNNLSIDNSYGVGRWTAIYDDRGNMIEKSFFDEKNQPFSPSRNQSPTIKWYYDKKTNDLMEKVYYDGNGNPYWTMLGFSKIKYKYLRGNRTEWAYCDPDDNPVLLDDGYAKVTVDYDDFGNPITIAFYGDDNKLILRDAGFAKVVCSYNANGDEVETKTFFGVEGDNRVLYENEYSKKEQKYDRDGNMTEQAFFGINNEPILLIEEGFAKVVWRRYDNEQEHLTERLFFGIKEDERVLYKGEFWKKTMKYNKDWDLTEISFFGVDDELILLEDGFAKVKYIYEDGKLTEILFFGADDELILLEDGFAKVKYKYEDEEPVEEAFFGVDGDNPVLCKGGYWKMIQKRNNDWFRTIKEQAFFGVDGKLILLEGDMYHEDLKMSWWRESWWYSRYGMDSYRYEFL